MSAVAVKKTRRDLRRAVGEEAVSIVESHEQRLRLHQAQLAGQADALNRVVTAGATDGERITKALGLIDALADDVRALRDRTFWGRLRWLLTGE